MAFLKTCCAVGALAIACAAASTWMFEGQVYEARQALAKSSAELVQNDRSVTQAKLDKGARALASVAASRPQAEWPELVNHWSAAYEASSTLSGPGVAPTTQNWATHAVPPIDEIHAEAFAGMDPARGEFRVQASISSGSPKPYAVLPFESSILLATLIFATSLVFGVAVTTHKRSDRSLIKGLAGAVLGASIACAAVAPWIESRTPQMTAIWQSISPQKDAAPALAEFAASLDVWAKSDAMAKTFALSSIASVAYGEMGGAMLVNSNGEAELRSGGQMGWMKTSEAPESAKEAIQAKTARQSPFLCGFIQQPCTAFAYPTHDGKALVVFRPGSNELNEISPIAPRQQDISILPSIGLNVLLLALSSILSTWLRHKARANYKGH